MAERRPAPFTIPSTIRVGRATWLILREHELDPVHDAVEKRQLERSHLGFAFPLRKEIHLARHKTERAACETFIHELLHACSSGKISERAEERFIRDIERRLMGALEQLEWVPRAMRVPRKAKESMSTVAAKRKSSRPRRKRK